MADVPATAARDRAVRDRAHAILGVSGHWERLPFRAVLSASDTGLYPLMSLCALAAASAAVPFAISLVTGPVGRSIGPGTLGSVDVYRPGAFALGSLAAIVALRRGAGRRPRVTRPAAARGASVALAASAIAAALATTSVAVLAPALVAAAAGGVLAALLAPMTVDAHRPEVRFRAVTAYGAAVVGGLGAAAVVVAVASGAGLTWRGQLLVIGTLALGATAFAWRLPDVAAGTHDRQRIRAMVEAPLRRRRLVEVASTPPLSLGEELRRMTASTAAPLFLSMAGAFGVLAGALAPFLDMFWRDRWGIAPSTRVLLDGVLLLAGLPLLLWFGSRGEVAARFALRRLLQLSGGAAATSGAALALAVVSPSFALAALLAVAGLAGFGLLLATSTFGLLALCEPARRPYAAAGLGLASVMGGIIGRVAMVTIGNRFGVVWALEIAAMVLVGLGRVGPVMRTIDADLDALVARMVELDELGVRRASGAHIPLLDCRHIDFAYGPLQVLFDVSLSVDEGEMVALLGTNGAGKSTLLRLISGLNVPHAGSIHYAGVDITFLDTDRRARLGIAQVPGGRAVFGPLTVVENLRAYGHTQGRDHRRVDQGIEAAFAAFPQLAEQRHSRAGLLSGGEQQMLGLAAAYILRPRLLLIDELSLGLAPIVIGELLDMVTRINDAGTAVVVVEQSVNIALSVVSHAYFMEKGEMRFDGRADDLVRRPDLLRSVFLEGTRAASVPIGARRSAARKVRA